MRFDDAFANQKYLADGKYFPSRWQKKAGEFRTSIGSRGQYGLAYGTGEQHWFDLFLPEGTPKGTVVFIHGGYWLAFGPHDFSHLAVGALARGWACAMPAYTLAPAARISAMTAEIATFMPRIAGAVEGPLVLAGHSAGGHLAARMACADMRLDSGIAARIACVVPVSPLSDLRPLCETVMAADLRLDLAEARAESPALLARRAATQVQIWVGSDERPRFLDQARRLGNAWSCPVTVEAGRHHFNVIEGLEQPDSALMQALLG